MATVLLVEDVDLQAALLRDFLTEKHRVVARGRTADEAVELARAKDPDVVVMDLRLESGHGLEASAAIKDAEPSRRVIVSTVDFGEKLKDQAKKAGADTYLTKPYSRDELLAAVDLVLS